MQPALIRENGDLQQGLGCSSPGYAECAWVWDQKTRESRPLVMQNDVRPAAVPHEDPCRKISCRVRSGAIGVWTDFANLPNKSFSVHTLIHVLHDCTLDAQ